MLSPTSRLSATHEKSAGTEGVGYTQVFSRRDSGNENNTVSVLENRRLSDIRVMLIGVRNKSNLGEGRLCVGQ